MALLFQLAEFDVAIFQGATCFDQLLVDQQALVQIGLPLSFEFGDRIGAGGELLGDFAAARLDLAQLGVHARQATVPATLSDERCDSSASASECD